MKQRIISAIIASILIIPIILIGGNLYKAGVIILALVGLYELIKAKENEKKIPTFMKIITMYFLLFYLLNNITNSSFEIILPVKYVLFLMITLLLGLIVYRDEKKYNIKDASYLFFINVLLSISFGLLMTIRDYNIYYLIIILLITIISDTFALVTGSLIGKHKFCPEISPNKTVEGFLGGLVFCLVVCVPTYITMFNYDGNILLLILLISILSIISTMGDLVFSAIKRNFKIKDYGKIMPGHGGVLDRMDSFLFVLLALYVLINYIV